jgi:thiopurine S-methyltransferase
MNPEFWLENWKNNKIGFHQQETNSHLTSFWQQLDVAPNCRVFVPLCGKSLDLIWLCQQGHNVLGVEVSDLAVSQFFSENGLTYSKFKQDGFQHYQTESLAILQGDFFNLTADQLQDVQGVFDRASLVALPLELRQKYVQHLKNILPDKAKILLVTFEYDQSQMNGPPFSVNEAEVYAHFQADYEIELLFSRDVLANYLPFQAAGLNSLQEKVYLLKVRHRALLP